MLETVLAFFHAHAWEIATVGLAPVAGFVTAHYIRSFLKKKESSRAKRRKILMSINGICTAVIAYWLWPGDFEDSIKIAVLLAIIGPLIVWAWFAAAYKWAPKQVSAISGTEENNWSDITYFSMFPSKTESKKDEDI